MQGNKVKTPRRKSHWYNLNSRTCYKLATCHPRAYAVFFILYETHYFYVANEKTVNILAHPMKVFCNEVCQSTL